VTFSTTSLGILSPKECLFPFIIVIVARSNPTELMHEEDCPPPHSLGLDGVQKLMLILLTRVEEEKNALLGNGN